MLKRNGQFDVNTATSYIVANRIARSLELRGDESAEVHSLGANLRYIEARVDDSVALLRQDEASPTTKKAWGVLSRAGEVVTELSGKYAQGEIDLAATAIGLREVGVIIHTTRELIHCSKAVV